MFKLRPYQQEAVDRSVAHMRECIDPALLNLATGAGKSLIVAEVARQIAKLSNKKVLCLAPSKELVVQNREKYLALGEPASMFSASVGSKCMRHDVVFGTPLTVIKSIEKFGSQFALVILDEAHTISPTIIELLAKMKEANKNLRILGLTATPYKMGKGYIYEMDENNKPVGDDRAYNPYYKKLLYTVETEFLIGQGFLTPPTTHISNVNYNTSNLEVKGNKFTAESVDQVFTQDQRLTHDIVQQVLAASYYRMGVMFFASTIQHAEEITRSLPPGDFALVTGKTKAKDRESIINAFKARKFKYLVNISVLTTGFDSAHVDVVAILRATESASLLQQIIGRGLRLHDEKADCLVMDFAENIERHGLEDNLFKPEIKVNVSTSEKHRVNAECECCGYVNDFGGRPNPDEMPIDANGYFMDLMGNRVLDNETKKPYPAHFGRRCESQELVNGEFVRCTGRWSFKECPHCQHENDIAARYCSSCKGELIDPNEKLKIEFKKIKKSPYEPTSDAVKEWFCQHHKVTKTGNVILKVTWKTDFRTFDSYYQPNIQRQWVPLCMAVFGRVVNNVDEYIEILRQGLGNMPETITSSKSKGARFVNIKAYNEPEDIEQ